jgi:hypothetical protein
MSEAIGARVSMVIAAMVAHAVCITVIAKRTYIVRSERVELAPEQIPLVEAPHPLTNDEDGPMRDPDTVVRRQLVDVVIEGHAHAPDGASEFQASVVVGELQRTLRVVGDRRCTLGANGRIIASSPRNCERIALDWRSAYGGLDNASAEVMGDPVRETMNKLGLDYDPRIGLFCYPRNRVGRGFLVSRNRKAIDECLMPNLEDPAHPLRSDTLALESPRHWPIAPLPVSLGWMPVDFFPRSAWAGLPPPVWDVERLRSEHFAEVRAGAVDESSLRPSRERRPRFSLRGAQSAVPGMQLVSVSPRAEILLENLHPRQRRFRTRLDGSTPRMVLRVRGGEPVDLNPEIRTVHIEPDQERLSLVWVGQHLVTEPRDPAIIDECQHAVVW